MITPHVSKPNTWRITIQKPKTQIKILSAASSKEFKSLPARGVAFGLRPFERAHSRHGDFLDQSAFCRRAHADPKDICIVGFDGKRIAGAGPIPSRDADSRSGVSRPPRCRQRDSLPCARVDTCRPARHRPDSVQPRSASSPMACRFFPIATASTASALAERMVANLGPHYATLLRGHGVIVTGPGIEGAVYFGDSSSERALPGSAVDDEHHRTSNRWPMPGAAATDARLENPYRGLAVSAVQTQDQVEGANPQRHPHIERRRTLLSEDRE